MLVLARKKGESIIIGDNVEIVILGTEGEMVRIGIKAPKHVEVFRKEVHEAIRLSNREASAERISPTDVGKLFRKK